MPRRAPQTVEITELARRQPCPCGAIPSQPCPCLRPDLACVRVKRERERMEADGRPVPFDGLPEQPKGPEPRWPESDFGATVSQGGR